MTMGFQIIRMPMAAVMLLMLVFLWAGLSSAGTPLPDPPAKQNMMLDKLSPQPEPPDNQIKLKKLKPRPSPIKQKQGANAPGPQPEPPDKTIKKGVSKSVK